MKKHLFYIISLFIVCNVWSIEFYSLQNSPEPQEVQTFRVEGSSDTAYQGRGSHYINPCVCIALVVGAGSFYAAQSIRRIGSWCVQAPYNGLSSLGTALSKKDFKDLRTMFEKPNK